MLRRLILVCMILIVGLAGQEGKKGDPQAGKAVFKAKCGDCHDTETKETKEGPGLQGVKDGKLPSGAKATHDTILEIVNSGRDAMPGFKDLLTDQQKEDVIAYVLTL